MKSLTLTVAALLFAVAGFAQTNDNAKNIHGARVSSTTKAITDADIKGTQVSTVASSKSQAEFHRNNNTDKELKAAVKAAREAKREELKALKDDAKTEVKEDNNIIDVKADARVAKEVRASDAKNARVKTGTKAGAKVGVGHSGVKTNVGAGLKLGL